MRVLSMDGIVCAVVLVALLLYCGCMKKCCLKADVDDPLEDGTSATNPAPTVCTVVQHDRVNALAVLADAKICTPNGEKDVQGKDATVLKAVLVSSMEDQDEGDESREDGCCRRITAAGNMVAEDVDDGDDG